MKMFSLRRASPAWALVRPRTLAVSGVAGLGVSADGGGDAGLASLSCARKRARATWRIAVMSRYYQASLPSEAGQSIWPRAAGEAVQDRAVGAEGEGGEAQGRHVDLREEGTVDEVDESCSGA